MKKKMKSSSQNTGVDESQCQKKSHNHLTSPVCDLMHWSTGQRKEKQLVVFERNSIITWITACHLT